MLMAILLAAFGFYANSAYAETTGSIVINYKYSDKALVNVTSYAYKVAEINGGKFELISAFENAGITNEDLNGYTVSDSSDESDIEEAQKAFASFAKTLYEYAALNGISYDASTVSDSNGVATYSGLSIGVYVIYSEPLVEGYYTYVTSPIMIAIPSWDSVNGTYSYDCVVNAKCEEYIEDVDYTVRKVWSDSGYESNRPSSITAKIYVDGEEYKTVTLSSSNSWKYSWSYEPGHTFTVTEVSTASNYSASVSQSGFTFTITNTYNPPSDDDTTDDDTPDDDTTTDTDEPEDATDEGEVFGVIRKLSDLPAVLGARRLPQTGLLWWPIPLLLVAGLVMIILGVKSLKNAHK